MGELRSQKQQREQLVRALRASHGWTWPKLYDSATASMPG